MPPELPPPTTWIQRWKSFQFRDWIRSLISPGDSEHELALGASIGIFVGFTPLFGLHLIIIILVAFVLQRLVRFNKALAVAASYINNPVTFAPMIWASYKVGALLMPSAASTLNQGRQLHELDWHGGIRVLPKILYALGLPMLVGCLLLGSLMALAAYPVTYGLVRWYRRNASAGQFTTNVGTPLLKEAVTTPAE